MIQIHLDKCRRTQYPKIRSKKTNQSKRSSTFLNSLLTASQHPTSKRGLIWRTKFIRAKKANRNSPPTSLSGKRTMKIKLNNRPQKCSLVFLPWANRIQTKTRLVLKKGRRATLNNRLDFSTVTNCRGNDNFNI